MLSEEFVSAICGPPLSSNTAVAKDVGIYCHALSPTYSVKSTFKKSSAPARCLAVSETHVFAAQHERAYVHLYSRLRGNQEAFVAFPERIRCLTLAGDVLVLGTAEGRMMLWEVRQFPLSFRAFQYLVFMYIYIQFLRLKDHNLDMHWPARVDPAPPRPGHLVRRRNPLSRPDGFR